MARTPLYRCEDEAAEKQARHQVVITLNRIPLQAKRFCVNFERDVRAL
ncbi:hypothetical protein PQU92_02100 [Asticcacaulis sp. BYS171W]|uniref:Uncharacterized protein n=1 Tax=Asticcacaulis aquaticus TaxID=2984212 RepID=A0ABT5HPR0_9CAUL|nr:hypothetical protein [Asticcacaulis aquaticus]MDC7682047.1 hypothetical protein [Asticcacaulis aquaticus]